MSKLHYVKLAEFCATRTYISLILAIIISVLGLLYFISIDFLVVKSIFWAVSLSNNESGYYQAWLKPENMLNMNIYIFNYSNVEQFIENCATLNVTEKGPYSYKVFSGRKVVERTNNTSQSTISYFDFKNFQFDENSSVGNLNDSFTTLDIPGLVVNNFLAGKFNDTLIKLLVGFLFQMASQSTFQSVTTDELLFKGKRVKIIDDLKAFWNLVYNPADFPDVGLKDNTFSFFGPHNVTYFGPFEIYADGPKMGDFRAWDNKSQMLMWSGDECNKLEGTDGTLFPPFVEKTRRLVVFVPVFCRKLEFEFEKVVSLRGIRLYRFALSSSTFASKLTQPSNWCYCNDDNDTSACSIDGITDISPCAKAPIWLSMPHFLDGQDDDRLRVDGLSPERDKHYSFIDIEPILGLPLRARMRLQINTELNKKKFLNGDNILCDKILPIIWFEYAGQISDRDAQMLRENVIEVLLQANTFKPVYFLLGFLFAIVAFTLGYCKFFQVTHDQ